MYKWQVPKHPKLIKREKYVNKIFVIGHDKDFNYDTLVLAVKIGDKFIKTQGQEIYTSYMSNVKENFTFEEQEILNKTCVKEYSKELAYVSLSIASYINEDNIYNIKTVAIKLENGYVFKLQWEICIENNFYIQTQSFCNILQYFFDQKYNYDFFYFLFLDICLDYDILHTHSQISLIIGILILFKNNKLKSINKYKEQCIKYLIDDISSYYDISPNVFFYKYLEFKDLK